MTKHEFLPCVPGALHGGLRRTEFYDGMVLGEDDMKREQSYWQMKRRLTNRALGSGVVWGLSLQWDATATRLIKVYDAVTRVQPRDAVGVARAEMTLHPRYWAFRNQIGGTGMALIDPERALLPRDTQRALAALARRPSTRVARRGWIVGVADRVLSGLAIASERGAIIRQSCNVGS